jgi:hypothetical protein
MLLISLPFDMERERNGEAKKLQFREREREL